MPALLTSTSNVSWRSAIQCAALSTVSCCVTSSETTSIGCASRPDLANADSAGRTPDEDPYQRKIPTFQAIYDNEVGGTVVKVGRIRVDSAAFQTRYEPGHPAADEHGYVRYPNVDPLIEAMDMREAQRAYEANLNVIETARAMDGRTLDLLKK